MSIAIERTTHSTVPSGNAHKPNFGSLVSAIRRGDLEGAQNVFAALGDLAPQAPGPLRKADLAPMREALAKGSLDDATAALKALQQGRLQQTTPVATPPTSTLALGQTVEVFI